MLGSGGGWIEAARISAWLLSEWLRSGPPAAVPAPSCPAVEAICSCNCTFDVETACGDRGGSVTLGWAVAVGGGIGAGVASCAVAVLCQCCRHGSGGPAATGRATGRRGYLE